MLAQLLKRDFVLKSLEKLNGGIREQAAGYVKADPNIRELLDQSGLAIDDLHDTRNEFEAAIARDAARAPAELDDAVFFPRDAVVSLAQSALQQFCEEKKAASVIQNAARGFGPAQRIPVTDMEMDPSLASLLSGAPPQRGLWQRYELLDIGWASCLAAIGVRSWRKRHPFNDQPAQPVTIGNRARVILLSDWASGLPRARKIGEAVRAVLDDPEAASRDKHVIHLGDAYYSGLPREYENNFLKYWPVKMSEAGVISSWALNANHDMYSGGWGYFDYLLRDDRRFHGHLDREGAPSSFFSLENDNWLILGLDTGYHENLIFDAHDLYGGQESWVAERLAGAPEKNGILLSHHQPFSAYPGESGGQLLLDKLKGPLSAERVRAWFWGHEHRCALYEPREKIEFPRCIGHGGIPFYVAKGDLPQGVIYEYRQGFQELLESWNYFGFVVMDFAEKVINVSYINERGTKHQTEVIPWK